MHSEATKHFAGNAYACTLNFPKLPFDDLIFHSTRAAGSTVDIVATCTSLGARHSALESQLPAVLRMSVF